MKFMVTMSFIPNPEIASLVPAERARVAELREAGILESLYLANDSTKAWLIMQGESREAVTEATNSLPLHKFANVEIVQLISM